MKRIRKYFSLFLVLMMILSCVPAAFAAEAENSVVHMDAPCSLTIYKYDFTSAKKDGIWNEDSFVSTGWRESYVEEVLGNAVRKGDANGNTDNTLGNGQNSNGYAIAGVEFSYLKVADIVTLTESTNDQHPDYNLAQVVYGFNKQQSADLLAAIGLGNGEKQYENADATDKLNHDNYYYTSDVLNKALSDALTSNSTTVKDALERYMAANNGTAMPLTNENGKSSANEMPVGLYLLVETRVPEMVTDTTSPFFISLPMTTVSGDSNSTTPDGGSQWNYDVVVYPKNSTGIPSLEKSVREASKDTGKNNGSDSITDGFNHNGTGSAGDVMEYQIVSTLPTITSSATALSVYNFYDSISEGLTYNKEDGVKVEIFTDKDCSNKVASWDMQSNKFGVSYSSDDRHMTVDISKAGLDEINGRTQNINGNVYMGYSNYTVRVTYTATINSNNSFVYGEDGNVNQVVLTWKRSSTDYYDTLVSDAHVYSFGIDLVKVFSDKAGETAAESGMYKQVKFKVWNATDKYWVVASRNDTEGVYYVTGHTSKEADATIFNPVTAGGVHGKVIIKGLEDDEYVITETATANGYVLLKDQIHVVITAADDATHPCTKYTSDILGVLQNDPHYAFDGGVDLHLAGIPQKALLYNCVKASATVDGNSVAMQEDNGSANAEAKLKVVNTPGFDLPDTGDSGTMVFTIVGVVLMVCAVVIIVLLLTHNKKDDMQ